MKHKEVNKLKYDHRAWEDLKKKPRSAQNKAIAAIYALSENLKKKFPEEKEIDFFEVARIVHEFYYKKQFDKRVILRSIKPIESFHGADLLLTYLEGINRIKGITSKITIEYKNPIKVERLTKKKTYRTIEQTKQQPAIKIELTGNSILEMFEGMIRSQVSKTTLKLASKNLKGKTPATFGEVKSKWPEFIAQYRKEACRTIYEYLNIEGISTQKRKVITMYALALAKFIPTYSLYVIKCAKDEKGPKAISENSYYSRKFSDNTKVSE